MRRSIVLAATLLLAGGIAAPVIAREPVSALPATYAMWNNKGVDYSYRIPIRYYGRVDAYLPVSTIDGVPSEIFSYVTTSDPGGALGRIASAYLPPGARKISPVAPNGVANTTLGGLIDAFPWGDADVVMSQCFGGGFAFNVAGSLQGAPGVPPPGDPIGYTFASASNFNEWTFNAEVYNRAATPVLTALANFAQGQAYAETPRAASLLAAYQLGKIHDPYAVTGAPYGVPNQVPMRAGMPFLRAGNFESSVYASADPPGPGGGPDGAGPDNTRTYATDAAHRWAVLVAFTPDKARFSLNIQREYAALIADGVPRNHIAVLYGGLDPANLLRFNNLTVANNVPNVNAILNTVGADFRVPFQGAASNANIAGLLDPNIVQNPTAPPAMRVDFWQALFGSGPAGARPEVGDSLMLYTTGHGNAVNTTGLRLLVGNRPGALGFGFAADFTIQGPSNVPIVQGESVEAQIAVLGAPQGLAGDIFSVNGVSVGPGVLASVAPGSALDVSGFLGDGPETPLSYLDLSIPLDLFAAMGGSSIFDLTVSNSDYGAVEAFQNSFAAYTWMDGAVDDCAAGLCDLYTDLVSQAPEPSTWSLLIAGCGAIGAGLRRRRAAA